jgi:hypothetical protein
MEFQEPANGQAMEAGQNEVEQKQVGRRLQHVKVGFESVIKAG